MSRCGCSGAGPIGRRKIPPISIWPLKVNPGSIFKLVNMLEDAFDESSLPYTVDIVDIDRVSAHFRRIEKSQRVAFPVIRDLGERRAEWQTATVEEVAEKVAMGPYWFFHQGCYVRT